MEETILVADDRKILAEPDYLPDRREKKFVFKLFVAGQTPRAEKNAQAVRVLLEAALKDRYVLMCIDVMENPGIADDDQVFATPTLIKVFPEPIKRVMGDLSNSRVVLAHLGLAS